MLSYSACNTESKEIYKNIDGCILSIRRHRNEYIKIKMLLSNIFWKHHI